MRLFWRLAVPVCIAILIAALGIAAVAHLDKGDKLSGPDFFEIKIKPSNASKVPVMTLIPGASAVCVVPEYTMVDSFLASEMGIEAATGLYVGEMEYLIISLSEEHGLQKHRLLPPEGVKVINNGSGCFIAPAASIEFEALDLEGGSAEYFYFVIASRE